jgi:hypothetical protein
VVPVSTGLSVRFSSLVRCCCRLFSHSVGVSPLTSLLGSVVVVVVGDPSFGMPPLTSLTPVVRIAGSTGCIFPILLFNPFICSISEFCRLPHSHFVMLDHTSSFKLCSGNALSSGAANGTLACSSRILHFFIPFTPALPSSRQSIGSVRSQLLFQ